ncbi:MAG: hypothetical protein WAN66_09775 [Limnoraphis robusta]
MVLSALPETMVLLSLLMLTLLTVTPTFYLRRVERFIVAGHYKYLGLSS